MIKEKNVKKYRSVINIMSAKYKNTMGKIEKHPFIAAVCLNVIFLCLMLIFCEIKYETSDDYIMAAIMGGKYGRGFNPHLIYINILWGYFLLPFYHIVPLVSWYLVFQLVICLCSFTSVTYLMFKKLDAMMAFMISILFITFYSDDAYIMMQFTKTAILAIMAGSLLFLDALFNEVNKQNAKLILGGALVIVGSLIRFDCIYIAGGFLLLILIIEFGRIFSGKNQNVNMKIRKVVLCGGLLIGCVLLAKGFDRYAYSIEEEYSYFRAYGNARSNIVDKKDYGYEVCEKEYKEIGISENDYKLLRTWNFADPEFYTLERLEKAGEIISDYENEQGIDRDAVKSDLKWRNYWAYPSALACLLIFILGIFLIKRCWTVSGVSIAIGVLYLVYFAIRGRLIYRIEYAVFLCVFITSIYFWSKDTCRKFIDKSELFKVCNVFIVLMCLYQVPTYRLNSWGNEVTGETYKQYTEDIFFASWDYDSRRYRCGTYNDEAFLSLQQEMSGNPRNYYFMNFSTTIQTLYLASNPWLNKTKEIGDNASYLAGVDINLPDNLKLLDIKNVVNPIKSLVNKEVYLVDNIYQEEILIYIREHYYPKGRLTLFKCIDGFQIWKLNAK